MFFELDTESSSVYLHHVHVVLFWNVKSNCYSGRRSHLEGQGKKKTWMSLNLLGIILGSFIYRCFPLYWALCSLILLNRAHGLKCPVPQTHYSIRKSFWLCYTREVDYLVVFLLSVNYRGTIYLYILKVANHLAIKKRFLEVAFP